MAYPLGHQWILVHSHLFESTVGNIGIKVLVIAVFHQHRIKPWLQTFLLDWAILPLVLPLFQPSTPSSWPLRLPFLNTRRYIPFHLTIQRFRNLVYILLMIPLVNNCFIGLTLLDLVGGMNPSWYLRAFDSPLGVDWVCLYFSLESRGSLSRAKKTPDVVLEWDGSLIGL